MLDVVYRLGPRGENDPLRYSLRSLANLPYGEVHVIGYVPKWLTNVNVLTPAVSLNRFRNSINNLYQACLQLAGRRFVLIDDDTYILRPIEAVEPLHAGDLISHSRRKVGSYGRTIRWTAEWLAAHDIESSLSYELHVPMPIEADACAAALEPALSWSRAVQARSVYGNTARIGGEYSEDVKIPATGQPDGTYLSTSPPTFKVFRSILASLFPERSVYEQ
jgi:hypothetical protein